MRERCGRSVCASWKVLAYRPDQPGLSAIWCRRVGAAHVRRARAGTGIGRSRSSLAGSAGADGALAASGRPPGTRENRDDGRSPVGSRGDVVTEQAPPSPLEEHDPDRARALKAKIRDRIGDVRRHLLALRAAMAEFDEDFDLDAFRSAYASDDPALLAPDARPRIRDRHRRGGTRVGADRLGRLPPLLQRLPAVDPIRVQVQNTYLEEGSVTLLGDEQRGRREAAEDDRRHRRPPGVDGALPKSPVCGRIGT